MPEPRRRRWRQSWRRRCTVNDWFKHSNLGHAERARDRRHAGCRGPDAPPLPPIRELLHAGWPPSLRCLKASVFGSRRRAMRPKRWRWCGSLRPVWCWPMHGSKRRDERARDRRDPQNSPPRVYSMSAPMAGAGRCARAMRSGGGRLSGRSRHDVALLGFKPLAQARTRGRLKLMPRLVQDNAALREAFGCGGFRRLARLFEANLSHGRASGRLRYILRPDSRWSGGALRRLHILMFTR